MSFENPSTPAYGEASHQRPSYAQKIAEQVRAMNINYHIQIPQLGSERIAIPRGANALDLRVFGTAGDLLVPVATIHSGRKSEFGGLSISAVPVEDAINKASEHYLVFKGTDEHLRVQEVTMEELESDHMSADPEKAKEIPSGAGTSIDNTVANLTLSASNVLFVRTGALPLGGGVPYTAIIAHNPHSPNAPK